jgi:hypothetical protein
MVIADTIFEATGISWQPVVSYESAELAVSGPGVFSFRREFSANEALVFLVNDRNLPALEDGQYAWELRFSPVTDAEVKEALRAARESGDSREIETLKREGKLPSEPLVISGYFRVKGGWIIADETEAGFRRTERRGRPAGTTTGVVDTDPGAPIAKDQVILDDLIVDGSICAGMDCVNGESFGFDTIRLKENNLRIRFVDTSSTSSFPSRDWQITVNDSANGGASKFSIDDIDGGRTPFTIEAGAPSHSLYVDDGGRLGLGTSTPVVDLHVKTGNTPTLRLEQDGSSGFTPQTWDVAGNEANFFIRDATNGSQLVFRIKPGAPTDSLFIQNNGRIGIGAGTSPEATVDVEADSSNIGLGNAVVRMANPNGGVAFQMNANNDATYWNISTLNADSQFRISKSGTENTEMTLSSSGNLSVFGDLSIGGTCTGCDAVFGAGYDLESIEEHAAFMWENSYLPAVGPTQEGTTRISVFEKTTGMINELEKAHIYIEQLHGRLKLQEQAIEILTKRLVALENTDAAQ